MIFSFIVARFIRLYSNNKKNENVRTVEPPLHLLLLFRAPKSTGKELFNLPWLQTHLDKFDESFSPVDVQCTLAHLTARAAIMAIALETDIVDEIVLCGGGAHNKFISELLQKV